MTDAIYTELARRLHRGSIDAIDGLGWGPQEGYIHLEPHCGAYSIGTDPQFWGGFLLGRGWMLASLNQDDQLIAKLRACVPYVERLSRFANVDTGFSGFFGLAIGHEITGDERLRESALEAASNVARLFHEDIGVFLTRPAGELDEEFDALPFSDVFCKRELLVDTGAVLDLMWWASKYESSYTDLLVTHFRRSLELGVVGPDGLGHHALNFHDDGTPKELHTHQGYQPQSRWTRAQAWASLGYSTAYLCTGLDEFKDSALKSINLFLDNLAGRIVGPYDFDTPDPLAPEDSCSTMITLAAMRRLDSAGLDLPRRFSDYQAASVDLVLRKYVTSGGTVLHGCWGTLGRQPREAVMPYGNYYLAETVFRELSDVDAWGLPVKTSAVR